MLKFALVLALVYAAFVVGFTAREPAVVHVQSPPEIVYEKSIEYVNGPVRYVDRVVTKEHKVIVLRDRKVLVPRVCPSVADALNRYELDIHGSF